MRRGVGAFAVREVGNSDMYSPSTVRGQDEGSLERKHSQGVSISATQDRPLAPERLPSHHPGGQWAPVCISLLLFVLLCFLFVCTKVGSIVFPAPELAFNWLCCLGWL